MDFQVTVTLPGPELNVAAIDIIYESLAGFGVSMAMVDDQPSVLLTVPADTHDQAVAIALLLVENAARLPILAVEVMTMEEWDRRTPRP